MNDEPLSGIDPNELKLSHDGYFREVFQVQRIAKAFLKKVLPGKTIPHLDLA